jgi:signal transduction histidine kinase
LTEATKKFSIGEYNIDVNQKGKDEVAILSREFAMMGNKIKEQIEAINAEKAKVDMMEKSRREFFNSVTHELKTPLTAISGYAQLLLSDMVRDKDFDKRALERIYAESERLYNLVLDLIDVSKGLYTANEDFTEVDIKKLITQICTDMNFKAKRYSLNIVNNLCEGTVKVQESKIRQVIINVLDNAIKYSTNGKDIYVNSSISDNKYIIEIVNTSTPIPQDIYENIFEPFVKSKSNSIADSRGMGLFLCKEILNDHDGEISIKNGEIIKVTIALNI